MNMLKITIPTGALLVSTLLAGTAIANNETGAATVEELIINDTLAQENPLTAPKDALSYQIASADGEENECDDDEDEDDQLFLGPPPPPPGPPPRQPNSPIGLLGSRSA